MIRFLVFLRDKWTFTTVSLLIPNVCGSSLPQSSSVSLKRETEHPVLSRGFCAGQQSLPCGETPETRSHAHFSFPKLREKKHVMLSAERLRHRGDKILQRHVFMQQNQVDDPFMDDICGDERTASNPQVEEKVQLTKHETGLKYVKLSHIVCTQMEHLISM